MLKAALSISADANVTINTSGVIYATIDDIVSNIELHDSNVEAHPDIREKIGDITNLITDDKTDLVAAVNEVRTQNNNFVDRGYLTTIRSDTDANNFIDNGKYTGKGVNFPDDGYWNIDVTVHATNLITQIASKVASAVGAGVEPLLLMRNRSGGTWKSWQKIITDKQPDWINATLQNGWVNAYASAPAHYYKNSFNEVFIVGEIKDGTVTSGTVILNLPLEYRPSNTIPILTHKANDGSIVNFEINTNGNLVIIGTTTTAGVFRFAGSFRAI